MEEGRRKKITFNLSARAALIIVIGFFGLTALFYWLLGPAAPLPRTADPAAGSGAALLAAILLSSSLVVGRAAARAGGTRDKLIETAFAGLPEAMVILSSEGSSYLANAAAKKFFPYLEKEGAALARREPWQSVIAHLTGDFRHRCSELVWRDRDGKTYLIRAYLVGAKSSPAIVATFSDQSQDQRLDVAESAFLSRVSHLLRTPLSAISWSGEHLIESGRLGRTGKAGVKNIVRLSERLTAILNDLLLLSRLETGSLPLRNEKIEPAVLLRHMARELEALCRRKKLRLAVTLADRCPAISADASYLHRAIQNLLQNAILVSPRNGRIEIRLESAQRKNPGRREVLISVRDFGPGISAAERQHIFQKFFRGDKVRREETEGIGLGLVLAREIVRAFGGRLTFTSRAGRGSSFMIALPAIAKSKVKGSVGPSSYGDKIRD